MKTLAGKIKTTVVLLLAVLAAGCGTYSQRMDEPRRHAPNEYYKGTAYDLRLLNGKEGDWTLMCYATILCPFATLASIPLDLAMDTILLPYDHSRAYKRQFMTLVEAAGVPGYGYIQVDYRSSLKWSALSASSKYTVTYRSPKNTLYLYVEGEGAERGVVNVYLPLISGYSPKSISIHQLDGYGRVIEVLLNRSRVKEFLKSNRAESPDTPMQDGVFAFYDDMRNDNAQSKIVARSFLNDKDASISVEAGLEYYRPRY